MLSMAGIRLQLLEDELISDVERNFVLNAAISKGIRVDGRALLEPRTCELHVSTIAKSKSFAQCNLGAATKVSCTVSAEMTMPYPDRPSEGMLSVLTDFMHSAGPSPSSTFDLQLVERAIQKAVDVESLCIVPGSRVWSVKCQIVVIDDSGSVMDACSIAACAALLHFRRPDITVVGEDVTIHSVEDRVPVPLSVHYIPLSVSYALLDASTIVDQGIKRENITDEWIALVDPTEREEAIANGGSFQVVLNAHSEICGLAEGGPFMRREEFARLIANATTIRKERGAILDDTVRNSPFLSS